MSLALLEVQISYLNSFTHTQAYSLSLEADLASAYLILNPHVFHSQPLGNYGVWVLGPFTHFTL